jgi:hypothetical protein
VDPPTATLVAIASSLTPAAAASRMCPLQFADRVLAATQQGGEFFALCLVQVHPVSYVDRCSPVAEGQMNPGCRDSPRFTTKQGQYLAFIHAYTLVLGRPPAEADMQRFFRVSPPAVHQMIV